MSSDFSSLEGPFLTEAHVPFFPQDDVVQELYFHKSAGFHDPVGDLPVPWAGGGIPRRVVMG